jgi:hypothetical protein
MVPLQHPNLALNTRLVVSIHKRYFLRPYFGSNSVLWSKHGAVGRYSVLIVAIHYIGSRQHLKIILSPQKWASQKYPNTILFQTPFVNKFDAIMQSAPAIPA